MLLFFSVSGASLGAKVLNVFSEDTYTLIFGVTAAIIAAFMFSRLNRRNVMPVGDVDTGVLGGVFRDDDTGKDVAYRVRRLPVAAVISFAAGVLASFIGVGGGIIIVPVLNTLCGVPMRVAAATSVLDGRRDRRPCLVVVHWAGGYLGDLHLAGATAVGVLGGFQFGLWLSPRVSVRLLKTGMAVLLVAVAVQVSVVQMMGETTNGSSAPPRQPRRRSVERASRRAGPRRASWSSWRASCSARCCSCRIARSVRPHLRRDHRHSDGAARDQRPRGAGRRGPPPRLDVRVDRSSGDRAASPTACSTGSGADWMTGR